MGTQFMKVLDFVHTCSSSSYVLHTHPLLLIATHALQQGFANRRVASVAAGAEYLEGLLLCLVLSNRRTVLHYVTQGWRM